MTSKVSFKIFCLRSKITTICVLLSSYFCIWPSIFIGVTFPLNQITLAPSQSRMNESYTVHRWHKCAKILFKKENIFQTKRLENWAYSDFLVEEKCLLFLPLLMFVLNIIQVVTTYSTLAFFKQNCLGRTYTSMDFKTKRSLF